MKLNEVKNAYEMAEYMNSVTEEDLNIFDVQKRIEELGWVDLEPVTLEDLCCDTDGNIVTCPEDWMVVELDKYYLQEAEERLSEEEYKKLVYIYYT